MLGFNGCICSPAGTVDLAAGTVTFGKQNMGVDSATGEMVVFQPLQLSEGTNDKGEPVIQAERVNSIVLNIQENGDLINHDAGFAFEISQGTYFAFGDVSIFVPDFFTFNEGEWTLLGDGEYTDNVMINFFEDAQPVISPCKYYTKGTEIAARNPYANGVWAESNPAIQAGYNKGEGFVVFDVAYEGCVPMRPITGSGFWLDEGEEGAPDWQETYLYNTEGNLIYNEEMYPEDVEMQLLAGGSPVSTFNKTTNIVTLENVWFGMSGNPFSQYGFAEERDPATGQVTKWKVLTVVCKLPAGVGVNGVEVAEEGAAKYFNLQGMEVVNPAKGQLVIKKQGNKAVKVVM